MKYGSLGNFICINDHYKWWYPCLASYQAGQEMAGKFMKGDIDVC